MWRLQSTGYRLRLRLKLFAVNNVCIGKWSSRDAASITMRLIKETSDGRSASVSRIYPSNHYVSISLNQHMYPSPRINISLSSIHLAAGYIESSNPNNILNGQSHPIDSRRLLFLRLRPHSVLCICHTVPVLNPKEGEEIADDVRLL
jgi:hypothetical protein